MRTRRRSARVRSARLRSRHTVGTSRATASRLDGRTSVPFETRAGRARATPVRARRSRRRSRSGESVATPPRSAGGTRRPLSHASAAGTRSRAGRERGVMRAGVHRCFQSAHPAAPTPPAVPVSACSTSSPEAAKDAGRRARRGEHASDEAAEGERDRNGAATRTVVRRLTSSLACVLLVSRVVVALVRGCDVGELREERVVRVRIHAVTHDVVRRRFVFPSQNPKLCDDRPTTGPYPPAMARISMSMTSSSSRRPLGKPANSPARRPSLFPVPTGAPWMLVFSRSRSACVSRWFERRHARRRMATRSARSVVGASSARVQAVDEPRRARDGVPIRELAVLAGIAGIPVVLLAERDDDLVDERIAQSRDLDQRAVGVDRAVTAEDADLGPARRSRRSRSSRSPAGPRAIRLRNLDRDRVHVVARQVVLSRLVASGMTCSR